MTKNKYLFTANYSDVDYVKGVSQRDPVMERALHYHCKKYFDLNYKPLFFVNLSDEEKKDIFQESFIALWENILANKIYVENGLLLGKGGLPFKGKLTTYFMSIAKYKYYEWTRNNTSVSLEEVGDTGLKGLFFELFYEENDDNSDMKLTIISDCLSHMSERCQQILSKFYYEMKTLDDIMQELTTFMSKDALKTSKYKCTETLRESAQSIYERYIN